MTNRSKPKKKFPPFDKFIKDFKTHLEEDLNITIKMKKVTGFMDPEPLQVYTVSIDYSIIYFIDLMKNYKVTISRLPRDHVKIDEIFELYPLTYDLEKFKEIKLFFYQLMRKEIMKHIKSSNTEQLRLESELILFS